MKKGFTLIELLVAMLIAGLVVGFAVSMLRDENSNMIHVRSRVQSQTAARDGLKIMESELRAAGFGVQLTIPDPATKPLQIGSVIPTCASLQDAALESSVIAMDGDQGGNDTLDLAFPSAVDGTTGAVCATAQWSRYLVDGGNLMRFSAGNRLALAGATPTVVGRNVDVFQVQLAATGISKSGRQLLGADSCCTTTGIATWTGSSVTEAPNATAKTNTLTVSGTWKYLSKEVDLSAGETWRVRVTVEDANSDLTKDLIAKPGVSYVQFGLYSAGIAVSTVGLLSRPTMATYGFGAKTEADLVVPISGKYKLGISGVTSATSGEITIRGFDALSVKLGADSTWLNNPSDLNADDWTRIKGVRVQVLTRAPADKPDFRTQFTGLANYLQPASSTPGIFNVTDTAVRVLLDHQYPAGNNGKF